MIIIFIAPEQKIEPGQHLYHNLVMDVMVIFAAVQSYERYLGLTSI